VQSVALRLIEIPTVSSDLLDKAREGSNTELVTSENRADTVLTIEQLQSNYAQVVETALGDLHLPASATLVDYEVTNSANAAPVINLVYLSEREIESDAQQLLIDEVRRRLESSEAQVTFEKIDTAAISLKFERNQTKIEEKQAEVLDRVAERLKDVSSLRLEISAAADKSEREDVAQERENATVAYLTENAKINSERLDLTVNDEQKREVTMRFKPQKSKSKL
jgi:outer membrane protein OmpA-like peptidoglycan-associated protein